MKYAYRKFTLRHGPAAVGILYARGAPDAHESVLAHHDHLGIAGRGLSHLPVSEVDRSSAERAGAEADARPELEALRCRNSDEPSWHDSYYARSIAWGAALPLA